MKNEINKILGAGLALVDVRDFFVLLFSLGFDFFLLFWQLCK